MTDPDILLTLEYCKMMNNKNYFSLLKKLENPLGYYADTVPGAFFS